VSIVAEAGDPTGGAREDAAAPIERETVGRNLANVLSSQVVSFALGLVIQIVQPRFVGPEGIGRVQLAFAIWSIAIVFVTFGTSSYLTLEMARDRDRGRALVGPIMLGRLVLFVVASCFVGAYAVAVGYDTEVLWLLAIAGVTMLFSTIAEGLSAAFVGMEQLRYPSLAVIVAKTAYTIVMVVVLAAGGGVYGLALTTIFQSLLTLALLRMWYGRRGPITLARPPGGYRALARASSGFLVAGAVIVIYTQIDMVAMSLLIDGDALGWYTVSDVLMSSMLFVPSVLMSVLFPLIGRLHVEDRAAVDDVMRRALSTLALAGVALGFGATVVAEPLCVLLYGEDFRKAGDVLAVLGIAAPFMFLTMMIGTLAQATGRKRFWTTLMAAAIVLSIGFDIVFVPLMDRVADNGAIGGALGYVATESLMVVIGVWKLAPGAWDRASAWRVGKIAVAGLSMVGLTWPLRDLFLAIPIAVGATVFVGAVVVLKILTPDEKHLLSRVAGKLPGGRVLVARGQA
jgi:O-antigen/teichoic acid export membrane protein